VFSEYDIYAKKNIVGIEIGLFKFASRYTLVCFLRVEPGFHKTTNFNRFLISRLESEPKFGCVFYKSKNLTPWKNQEINL